MVGCLQVVRTYSSAKEIKVYLCFSYIVFLCAKMENNNYFRKEIKVRENFQAGEKLSTVSRVFTNLLSKLSQTFDTSGFTTEDMKAWRTCFNY